jgi:hypothetical protein
LLRSHCRPAAMVRPRLTYYKCLSARFCRFFCTPEPQLSCGRNSLSASGIVRKFSCGRWRGEQQSSTGDPDPRHEFGRVPPPHGRRALRARAAPGHRFSDMNNRVIVAARLPAHAPRCGEACWHSPRLPGFGSVTSAPQHHDARMANAKSKHGRRRAMVRCVPCATIRAPPSLRVSRSTAGLFPGFHPDRKPPMIYLNSGFDSCREGSPTGRAASHFQT